MAISDLLRQAIRDSGVSANALAKACDVPQPTISTFLLGKDIRMKSADKLAAYFGLTLTSESEPSEQAPARKKSPAKKPRKR